MTLFPTKLELISPTTLRITWNDDRYFDHQLQSLRDLCPCATCREKRAEPPRDNPLQILSMTETQPLRLTGARPVGNYAYAFEFSDGHDSGIYTLEFLREFGEKSAGNV